MLKVIEQRTNVEPIPAGNNRPSFYYLGFVGMALAVLYLGPRLNLGSDLTWRIVKDGIIITWIVLALIGLLLIEHIYRNTNAESRVSIT